MRVRLGTPVAYPQLLPLYERKARFSEPGAGLWETPGRGTGLARVSLERRTKFMSSNLGRTGSCARVLFLAFLLELTRCGLPPVTGQAAEIRPAIIITEGNTKEGFPYMFGGVSSNEREAMEERAKEYNLKLVLAEKNGPYISGVTVTLSSVKEGEILAVATEGPWFYIRLPAGTYDITANFKGQTKRVKNLSLTKDKKVQQIFIWDLGTQAEP